MARTNHTQQLLHLCVSKFTAARARDLQGSSPDWTIRSLPQYAHCIDASNKLKTSLRSTLKLACNCTTCNVQCIQQTDVAPSRPSKDLPERTQVSWQPQGPSSSAVSDPRTLNSVRHRGQDKLWTGARSRDVFHHSKRQSLWNKC